MASGPNPQPPTKAPVEDKTQVAVNASQYRSMILAKLRADIEAKQAAYKAASVASVADLSSMSYWKMAYYKMKYWKMGKIDLPTIAVDPAPERG